MFGWLLSPVGPGVRILFLTHYFPPEVNAPAIRTLENCREWVKSGDEVHVITCVPSHPTGRLYPGYRRVWYSREIIDGIHVHRVWTYLAANSGALRRLMNYISFVPTAVIRSLRLGKCDVIIATSPQFFCAVAGGLAAGLKKIPWVFELRDLWPDSIVAVGAMRRNLALRLLEKVELHLYRSANRVVCVTRSFAQNLAGRGVPEENLAFIPNGMDIAYWAGAPPSSVRERWGIRSDDFVASYVGTVGMAHGLATILDAARTLHSSHPRMRFLVVGDGAERENLVRVAREQGLSNVSFTGLMPRDDARDLLLASDVALVLLKKKEVFETVIPSKMLEAFAAGRPVVLGVGGEAKSILEASCGGIAIPPEDGLALAEALVALESDPVRRWELGEAGREFVGREYNRISWASVYRQLLTALVNP
jgi:glycosyltransferase involved in cell wall biosynthesis